MKFAAAAFAVASVFAAGAMTPASATMIGDGTVSSAYNFIPEIDISTSPATYAAIRGATFQTSGKGGFAGAQGGTGTLNGTILFSTMVGTTLDQTLNNLFVFSDGTGGTFNFSATSVRTDTFTNPGPTTSGSIYLLGTTIDSKLGYEATSTSLTISFNRTGDSSYSSSATLAVPPDNSTPVPEPLSIALLGTGLLAAGVVRRVTSKA